MAALEHLNGEQLRMFMTANEITKYAYPVDKLDAQTPDSTIYDEKYEWALKGWKNSPSLKDHILTEGMPGMIHLGYGDNSHHTYKQGSPSNYDPRVAEVVGGHHRLSVLLKHKPDTYVPVMHHNDLYEAQKNERYS